MPASPDTLIPRILAANYTTRGGDLLIGGIAATELAKEHGTPLYVYDGAVIRRQAAALQQALPGFTCHYSVKANPNPSLIRLLLESGCRMEVASAGELELVLACGCAAHDVLFAGPGKTDAELELALKAGIGEIHVESFQEIERLNRIAAARGQVADVALRVNPAQAAQGGAQQMGGKATAFGIDEEELEQAVAAIRQRSHLKLTGLHVYAGTQNLSAPVFQEIYQHIISIARRITELTGEPLRMIDFGGGFGVPYFPGEEPLDLVLLKGVAEKILASLKAIPALANTRLVVEPGRFLTAEGGAYITKVLATKESRGSRFAILDGGLNHHLSASGQFGQIVKRNFPIVVANKIDAAPATHYELAGPLCTPLDIVGRRTNLPELAPGDLVAILQSGAYARTSSPHGFLSHPNPMEVLVDGGRSSVIRQRGDFPDMVRGTILDTP